jgi:two-component system OmpR family sensor kinase
MVLVMAIVAAGLIISDVATYNSLRSFLVRKVDEQLDAAAFPVGRALLSTSGLGPQVPAAPRSVRVHPDYHSLPGTAFLNGGGLDVRSRGLAAGVLVPAGTYGLLRNTTGVVQAHLFFDYGGATPTAPRIPSGLPGSGAPAGPDLYFTTSSSGPGAVTYRAVAKPLVHGAGAVIIAIPLSEQQGTLRDLLLVELIVSAVLLLGLGALSWVMVRRDLRPLVEITETAGAIAHGDLSQRVSHVVEGTEVGQLGQAFNTMIDEIEVAFAERTASEERLRRFLADASHELRTPLTSIRGYAELFDLGIRDRPEELAQSIHHIKEEASRMSTLVDDLFLLAQLDRERPLRIERVDLAEMAVRSAEAVGVSEPQRPVVVDAAEPVEVDGDGLRLRQVVDNLVVNALIHTPVGTVVVVTVATEGQWAVLTVRDEGPGIEPAQATRIFEPFFRSDPSRSRASGGAGLGLAIVAAIVGAHDGTVRVVSAPGQGATFEVRIPRYREEVDGHPGGGSHSGGEVRSIDRPTGDVRTTDRPTTEQ